MKNVVELIDIKSVVISLMVFIVLVVIFTMFFVLPTKNNLEKTRYNNVLLKEKIKTHEKLFPLYVTIKQKLKKFDESIKLNPKKMTILECVDHIFVSAPTHNLIVLSVNPFMSDKKIEKNGKLNISVELSGKYIDFLKWLEEITMQGMVDNIKNIYLENVENNLKITLNFLVNV